MLTEWPSVSMKKTNKTKQKQQQPNYNQNDFRMLMIWPSVLITENKVKGKTILRC